MIQQNRALLASIDERLAEIARQMRDADRDRQRTLQRATRLLKRTRWRTRLVGWALYLLDTR